MKEHEIDWDRSLWAVTCWCEHANHFHAPDPARGSREFLCLACRDEARKKERR